MYRVAALLYPQALTTSITLPLEILTAAAQIAQVKSRLNAGVTVSLAAADAAPVSEEKSEDAPEADKDSDAPSDSNPNDRA